MFHETWQEGNSMDISDGEKRDIAQGVNALLNLALP
jgi:hypothetical protein